MKILVTGGTGYIGSHTLVELVAAGYEAVVIDDLSNSQRESLTRVEEITGAKFPFYGGDVRDKVLLEKIFREHEIDAVIHFAGLKAVGESVTNPLRYYDVNVGSSVALLECMKDAGVRKIVFSSSATVYGDPEELPLRERSRAGVGLANPYGRTKWMIEEILCDLAFSDNSWKIIALRYFNPVGAHESGKIGEEPNGIPNNLFPYLVRVASGRLPKLRVFGGNYDTPDGSGVRDYLHVTDLARGHVSALDHLEKTVGMEIFNLGTGKGTSVLEAIHIFEKATGKKVPYEIAPRRPGDVASCYAEVSLAKEVLGWQATHSLEEACRDMWKFESRLTKNAEN
ncbi:MAG TPA: UDP-glucose 4-epimerase GalE [Candidatus Paceibacterota bacterium]|nr:UDP-glucose 4-epimerase GalE [Candidatus Paceibacterota bacterium]